jgi:hypothetical protein
MKPQYDGDDDDDGDNNDDEYSCGWMGNLGLLTNHKPQL